MQAFSCKELAAGLWRIVDVLGNHAYLVTGSTKALLVDTCGGIGDVRECVERLTSLPVEVALTHGHYDHAAGAYRFDAVHLSEPEMTCWETVEEHAARVFDQVVREGGCRAEAPFALWNGVRPRQLPLREGDLFFLGGRTVRVVALPGHTAGSLGYLIEDARVLLSGDAVTPIMCLFFADSCGIDVWRQTLAKMRELPFSCFYTGHHDHAFTHDDLDSFDAAAAYALGDRGVEWCHLRLPEHKGILHLCPCGTSDADSPSFRAVIEPWHELPVRKRRKAR